MSGDKIIYALAALCFVLGFVALLMQKTYIDNKTHRPTEIELPMIGKLKTNFPALVFVLIGAFLVAFVWSKPSDLGEEQWTVTGSLHIPAGQTIKWQDGTFALLPRGWSSSSNPNGTFEMTGPVKRGRKFEDTWTHIVYANGDFNAQINILDEYNKFVAKKPSLILSVTDKTRDYAPVNVQRIAQ